MNVVITGVSGFLGRHLSERLLALGSKVAGISRGGPFPVGVKSFQIKNYNSVELGMFLVGYDAVIHCAARAHIMRDDEVEPLSEYRRVNVDSTLILAKQAAAAGIKRFIFISSVKVNGEETPRGRPFKASDEPAPEDPYALSKLEAEQELMRLAHETCMEVVIIRPPLVYGPRVKGNFASMIKLVKRGIPLPLGSIYNKRSLIGIDNLVDLIIRCIDHPRAANQVFLAGDGEDLSTTELLQGVAKAMDRPARLVPVPARLLQFGAALLGKKAVAQRLLGSLQVDISKTCELLEWRPPYTVEESLKRCFPKPHETSKRSIS